MIIKVDNDYLDFNDSIQIEKQSRLFEAIDFSMGDFSYRFNIPFTSKNNKILTFPMGDMTSKKIFNNIDCELQDDDGIPLYKGFLRVERTDYQNHVFICSFFSGNNNWIGQLSGNISAIDFSEFNIDINRINIEYSWQNKTGIIFPLFSSGNLVTRSHNRTVPEDWTPMIFARTLFEKILNAHSIKLAGELTNDWVFNNMLVCSNPHNQDEIDNRTSFAQRNITETISGSDTPLLTFQNISTYPYFNSPNHNYSTGDSSYTSDSTTKLKIEITIGFASILEVQFALFKNGSGVYEKSASSGENVSIIFYIDVIAGDKIQFYTGGTDRIIGQGSIKVTPIFLYNVRGSDLVPKWTQQQFIKNILSLFNVVTAYDPYSKTLTVNFFDGVKDKEPINIDEIEITSVDFIEFISNYGKNNYFSYQDGNNDDIKRYNINKFIKYAQGNIPVNNDYLQPSVDILNSDFTSPISYISQQFGSMSLEKTNIFELENGDQVNITSVSNNSGIARFNIDQDIFIAGNLIKIEMDTTEFYNGEWVITNVGSGYFDIDGIDYQINNTGKATIQITKTTSDDNVFIFINTGQQAMTDISTDATIYIGTSAFNAVGYCYFNLLNTGLAINEFFNQSLSFGAISNNLSFQRNMLDQYWRGFGNVLNDPTKLYAKAYIPKKKFLQLTPLNPTSIKTNETSNLYYINRITAYENIKTPCIMELIKL